MAKSIRDQILEKRKRREENRIKEEEERHLSQRQLDKKHEKERKKRVAKLKESKALKKSKALQKSHRIPGIYRELLYNSMIQRESVVILCAGPSLNVYNQEVIQYIRENNSLVISANYDFRDKGMKSHYTYITDQNKLIENVSKIQSHLVIPVKMKTDYNQHGVEQHLKAYGGRVKSFISTEFDLDNYKAYQVGVLGKQTVYSAASLKIGKKGRFPYRRLGSAGQGAMMVSLLANPKKMLLVGLDGPNKSNGGLSKSLYDGRSIKYDENKFDRIADYIGKILIPCVKSRGVTIDTFENVAFYGLNKKKLGVNILG